MTSLRLEKNLAQTFFKRVELSSSRSAMIRKVAGTWRTLSWTEYQKEVCAYALALQKEGLTKGGRVAILSNSRPEWAWIDVATLCLGAVSVPIYPSLLSDDIEFIIRDSGCEYLFVEDASQKKKIDEIIERLPQIKRVIVLNETPCDNEKFINLGDWFQQCELPEKDELLSHVEKLKAITQNVSSEELASIVYTSGTSGMPKGVELSHECFLGFMRNAEKVLGMSENDTTLLFLPLAHILGRVEHMLSLGVGWTNAYAENLKVMMDNIVEVRPTVLVSVPRIYEKIYSMVLGKVSRSSGIEKIIGSRAVQFANIYSRVLESGKKLDLFQKLQHQLYSKALYEKVYQRFGGRLRYCISGGAPFSAEISRFFHASGVHILEGYGLTETTGPLTVNRPENFRIGSVGQALEEIELKIAEDGEILARGPMVLKKYHNNPEATSEVIDKDGFFATGDIGRMDSEGFVYITDRKKDIIVTAGGKNIAPQKIESLLLEDPLFAQSIVVGDKQKYLGALVALNVGELRQLVKEAGVEGASVEELYANPKIQSLVYARVQKTNTRLPSFENIKKIRILPRELSVEEGEMTPSLKVKRKFCQKKYSTLIDSLFT
jgi:long-chain acyl-CoA synthetase